MSLNVLVYAATFALCSFLSGHSLWRFMLRRQLPSVSHATTAGLVAVYVTLAFQEHLDSNQPTTLALVTGAAALVANVLVVRHELKQPHPWN